MEENSIKIEALWFVVLFELHEAWWKSSEILFEVKAISMKHLFVHL